MEADIHDKSVKSRLDELRELFDGGYITESEFKIARLNILNDGGIDVVTQLQQAHRAYFQEEEPRGGGGCGGFLLTLLLAVFFLSGVAFFAAPYWPEQLGGEQVRAAREWFTSKGTELTGGFFADPDGGLPDPVPSGDVTPDTSAEPVTIPSFPPAPVPGEETSTASFDLQISPVSSPAAEPIPGVLVPAVLVSEPDIRVIELGAAVSDEPEAVPSEPEAAPSADLRSENAIRGSVTAQSARIRSEPDTSTNDNVVGWGRTGDRFVVLEEGTGSDGSTWYHIMYEAGDKHGWISGALVRLER